VTHWLEYHPGPVIDTITPKCGCGWTGPDVDNLTHAATVWMQHLHEVLAVRESPS
jgi:hypothetical protein